MDKRKETIRPGYYEKNKNHKFYNLSINAVFNNVGKFTLSLLVKNWGYIGYEFTRFFVSHIYFVTSENFPRQGWKRLCGEGADGGVASSIK